MASRPVIEQAGVAAEVQAAMTAVLRDANEDPGCFLVHSPYVVHHLRLDKTALSGRKAPSHPAPDQYTTSRRTSSRRRR